MGAPSSTPRYRSATSASSSISPVDPPFEQPTKKKIKNKIKSFFIFAPYSLNAYFI